MKMTAKQLAAMGFTETSPGLYSRVVSLGKQGAYTEIYDPVLSRPPKPLLNKLEERRYVELSCYRVVRKQAITLRLDPPFRSYTPDLAYQRDNALVLVEVKGPHRFREKGIAKAALAAKTYPEFVFELHDWDGERWKVTTL